MDRRDFLLTLGITLVSASAYSFGNSIKPLIDEKSEKIALIYGTRYGATEDTSKWIAKGIGDSVDVLNIETIEIENLEGFEYLSRIIEDISTYLFEYFVSRVFVDVYLFEDSLKNSIQFMKDRLRTKDTSNDASELSFFDD